MSAPRVSFELDPMAAVLDAGEECGAPPGTCGAAATAAAVCDPANVRYDESNALWNNDLHHVHHPVTRWSVLAQAVRSSEPATHRRHALNATREAVGPKPEKRLHRRMDATRTARHSATPISAAATVSRQPEMPVSLSPGAGHVEPRTRSEVAERVVNVLVAGLALVIASPLILVAAILIKLTSRGPVFYRQVRVGIDKRSRHTDGAAPDNRRARDLGGRVFSIYKLRTMYTNAEAASGAVWAKECDSRVTPVGRVLRKFRIDELPQLLNVIQNTMSIVGPRPERPSIFAKLSQDIEEYAIRQRAKPGITGWAQINHTYDSCIEDVRTKVRYDLEYLRRQSVAQDVMIMAKTLPVMLLRKGGW